MPKLPSGLIFALDSSPVGRFLESPRTGLMIHQLLGFKSWTDLFPFIDILFFAPPSEVPADRAAEFSSNNPEIAGLKAYSSGHNIISICETLSADDQRAFTDYIRSTKVKRWLQEPIWQVARAKKKLKIPDLYVEHPFLRTKEESVFQPTDFGVKVDILFPKEQSDWKTYASDDGYLRIRPTVTMGAAGLQGSLALGNPPRETALDAWEASKEAGVWDYWSFLSFVTIPSDIGDRQYVLLFFETNTFFERPLEVVTRLQLDVEAASPEDEDSGSKEATVFIREWFKILRNFELHLGASSLKGKIWTREVNKFDVGFPDET